MKTLDRYIIRQFLINFVILFAVLMLLFVLVDLIVDLDEFVQAGQLWADRYGGVVPATLVAIGGYYGPMVVLLYVFFSGLLVAGATGFTLVALHRTRELTAIVASGLSMYRIAAPMLLVGIVLNAAALPLQEFVIPDLAPKLARSKRHIKRETVQSFPLRFVPDENGHLISAAQFGATEQTLTGVTILERDEHGLTTRRIAASGAEWEERRGQQGWRLHDVQIDQLRRAASPADLRGPGASGGLGGPGGPGARQMEASLFFETELSPTVLLARQAKIYSRLLSMSELQAMQQNPAVEAPQRDQIKRIIWSRLSLQVTNTLILVMGMTFFLQLGQANMLVQAVKAAGLCLGAWGGGLIMLQAGAGALNPVAAAWLPVVIYLPVSAVLLQTVKT